MEATRQLFIKATVAFSAIWFNSTTRHYIVSDSQNTISLGKNQLAQFKARLKDLTDNAQKNVADFLLPDSLWYHLSQDNRHNYLSAYSQNGINSPEIIAQPIRKGLGKLGVLLEEYGYNVATKAGSYDDKVSIWNNKNVSPYPTYPIPYYPNSLDWSTDMKVLMKKYDTLCKLSIEANSNIKRLQNSKIEKQAADLWDSV